MAMNGNDRGDADYEAVTGSNPYMDKLSPEEKDTLKAAFRTLYSADTGYITGNMDVLPAALSGQDLELAIGAAGQVTSGAGSGGTTTTLVPNPLSGKGSVA